MIEKSLLMVFKGNKNTFILFLHTVKIRVPRNVIGYSNGKLISRRPGQRFFLAVVVLLMLFYKF